MKKERYIENYCQKKDGVTPEASLHFLFSFTTFFLIYNCFFIPTYSVKLFYNRLIKIVGAQNKELASNRI